MSRNLIITQASIISNKKQKLWLWKCRTQDNDDITVNRRPVWMMLWGCNRSHSNFITADFALYYYWKWLYRYSKRLTTMVHTFLTSQEMGMATWKKIRSGTNENQKKVNKDWWIQLTKFVHMHGQSSERWHKYPSIIWNKQSGTTGTAELGLNIFKGNEWKNIYRIFEKQKQLTEILFSRGKRQLTKEFRAPSPRSRTTLREWETTVSWQRRSTKIQF